MKIRKVLMRAVSIIILAIASSCTKLTIDSENMIKFCPEAEEIIARSVLGLGELSRISEQDFLLNLDKLGFNYEVKKGADLILTLCAEPKDLSGSKAYMVYTGFDSSKEFTRNYLVVLNEFSSVSYIEARYAYKPVKLFP